MYINKSCINMELHCLNHVVNMGITLSKSCINMGITKIMYKYGNYIV